MENLRKRIRQIKESRPVYQEILDFYQKVREEQERITASLGTEPVLLKKKWKEPLTEEDFPLVRKQDFPLNVTASIHLFHSLCQIAKEANPFMSEQVRKIEETIEKRSLDLKELLREGWKDERIERTTKEFEFDKTVFLFLVQNSLNPSIQAGMKQVSKELGSGISLRGTCPICGSLPYLALLGDEVGKRSLLCSFCGYQWNTERFLCPFCNNRDQESLHYLYAEDEKSCRIDVCEQCRHYIKTIDLRKAEVPDPPLEDLATLHLDIVAYQKGYERPAPTLWIDKNRVKNVWNASFENDLL